MRYRKYNLLTLTIAFFIGLLLNAVPSLSHGAELKGIDTFRKDKSLVKTLSEQQDIKNNNGPNYPRSKEVLENVRIDNYENKYLINSDYTYTLFKTQKTTLLTQQGVENSQRDYLDYSPDTQSLELVEAYVVQPNGEKIKVTDENIFTRSSPEYVPGFNNNLRMTVVFSRLMVGSQTFVRWKLIQEKPSIVGFTHTESPFFSQPTVKESIEIELPASLKLNWKKRGNYVVTDTYYKGRRVIKAVITNKPSRKPENFMVHTWDFDSIFVFSNLDSWEEIGRIVWDKWRDKIVITPEIKKLALEITGDKQGVEAARLVYNWVAKNIKYLAVYLNESAGYIPHTSTEILRNGYGDCKDHVLLMHTLLKAIDIESFPAFVHWGDIYRTLPLPTSEQFNHAIIYLPDYNIFANPTDNYSSFEELDNSLNNKFVVLLTEKGLTKNTPKSSFQKNGYEMKALINIDNNATIKGQSYFKYFGNLNSTNRKYFASDTPKQIANKILADTPEGGTGTLETSDLNNLDLPVTVKAQWSSPYAVNMENQIYLTTPVGINTIHPRWLRRYITFGKRYYPFIVWAGNYSWEYKITIPSGYKIIHQAKNKDFSNTTGSYKSSYEQGNGYILIKRNLVLNKNVYSAEEYPAFQGLIYKPINDARSVIVLEKTSVLSND